MENGHSLCDQKQVSDEPALRLVGLSIWIDGRQFPDSRDYHDGNWLNVRARMEAHHATVKCGGAILMTTDFARFRTELLALHADVSGKAELSGYERDLKLTLSIDHLGHGKAEVEITPDHLNQFHRFSLDFDQSYLPALIHSLDAILERFPVINTGA